MIKACHNLLSFKLLLLGILTCLCACSKQVTETRPPNVIVILTDDQAWGDVSYHSNTNLSTPNIDQIAKDGAVLENFYVQPVCSPTRAELLTGQYSPRLGVYATSAGGERMNLGVPTVAELFKDNGYTTAAYGKWHNGTQPPYHPNSRGFDDFYGFCSGHWGDYYSPMLEHNGEITQGEGFLVDDLFNHGIEFIAQQRTTPFFLYLPVNTPHSPMQVPDRFWDKFSDGTIKMKVAEEDELYTKAALAMVENIDWNIGRLTEFLKAQSLEDNTIIVFMSDNGPARFRWNGNLRGKKGSTDEGGVKSPFFIKWPKKIKPGTVSAQLMGAVDLLPTLAGLAQIPLSDSLKLDGLDISQYILTENHPLNNRTIFNHWKGKTSVRIPNYRLDNENRLYHLTGDIGQTIDISASRPKLKDSLVSLKNQWENELNTQNTSLEKRRFPIGDGIHGFAQLPARDGLAHGEIKRSNRWPNDSFYTNWITENDSITWDVDILNDSTFEVFLYYTCKPQDVGTELELKINEQKLIKQITESHDPPLVGKSDDRYPRMESYVKEFKPISMGKITGQKGVGTVSLKAISIPGESSIDFRLLYFKRIGA